MNGGIRKRGDTWYYYFDAPKENGKRRKIERKGGKTRKEASKALLIALSEHEKSGAHVNSKNISLSQYLDFWYKNYVELNCKYSTISGYKIMIEKQRPSCLCFFEIRFISTIF